MYVTADSNAGAQVGDLYPSLRPAYGDLTFASYDAGDLGGVDVVFTCLPHGASQLLVPELLSRGLRVVDLGADFRLPAETYQRLAAVNPYKGSPL